LLKLTAANDEVTTGSIIDVALKMWFDGWRAQHMNYNRILSGAKPLYRETQGTRNIEVAYCDDLSAIESMNLPNNF